MFGGPTHQLFLRSEATGSSPAFIFTASPPSRELDGAPRQARISAPRRQPVKPRQGDRGALSLKCRVDGGFPVAELFLKNPHEQPKTVRKKTAQLSQPSTQAFLINFVSRRRKSASK